MNPVTVATTIARPREAVFEYLADIANHPEFSDHYLVDWRLTRAESYGRGAGARFRIKARLMRFGWADVTLVELEHPWRIVAQGRGGKFNRTRMRALYTLSPAPGDQTRVELETETEPPLITDKLVEGLLGAQGWTKRKTARALRRLRSILEEDRDRGRRVTVAGG